MNKSGAIRWARIENSAKIYPMIYGTNGQNIFRIAFELNESADENALRLALADILPSYPSFNVKTRRGIFWHYFEENDKPPVIWREEDIEHDKIDFKSNNGYLFRVCYFNRVVAVDFYHSVTDGKGGLEFCKAILLRYMERLGYPVSGEGIIRPSGSPQSAEEMEDAFLNNYEPVSLKEVGVGNILGKKGYSVQGVPFDGVGVGFINATTPIDAVKSAAKRHNATVTEYLGGLLMYSIYKTNYRDFSGRRPIKLLVPINLRRFFSSKTLRNFTLATIACAEIKSGDLKLEYFIEVVKNSISNATTRQSLKAKISGIVKIDKNFLIKLLPLPVKSAIFFFVQRYLMRFKTNTATLTNPAIVDVPKSMKPYIKSMYMALIPIRNTGIVNCAVISYDGKISITFTRRYKDAVLFKFFFGELSRGGAELTVTGNS